jgi:SAM-dependent methyltransferase
MQVFDVCPVEQAERIGTAAFDVICCFNSFYAFSDKPAALQALAYTAKPGALLALFDYTDPGTFSESLLGKHVELLRWHPLNLSSIGSLLSATAWSAESIQDITADYVRWYKSFSDRIRELRPRLIQECGMKLGNTTGKHRVVSNSKMLAPPNLFIDSAALLTFQIAFTTAIRFAVCHDMCADNRAASGV